MPPSNLGHQLIRHRRGPLDKHLCVVTSWVTSTVTVPAHPLPVCHGRRPLCQREKLLPWLVVAGVPYTLCHHDWLLLLMLVPWIGAQPLERREGEKRKEIVFFTDTCISYIKWRDFLNLLESISPIVTYNSVFSIYLLYELYKERGKVIRLICS